MNLNSQNIVNFAGVDSYSDFYVDHLDISFCTAVFLRKKDALFLLQ